MRLLLLLLFSFFSLCFPFEYYSAGGSLGLGNVMDNRAFSIGTCLRGDFNAYSQYFYIGGTIGFNSWLYEATDTKDRVNTVPISFVLGTSSFGSGENLDSWRYFLGLGLGYNKGYLTHQYRDFSGHIVTADLAGDNFHIFFEGGFLFLIGKDMYIGPSVSYRMGDINFNGGAFSNVNYSGSYDIGGFSAAL